MAYHMRDPKLASSPVPECLILDLLVVTAAFPRTDKTPKNLLDFSLDNFSF